MSNTIQVKGLQDLHKVLQMLPTQIETNVLRGGLYAAAKVIRDEAKRLAPVSPPTAKNRRIYGGYAGALRDSIRAGAMVDKRAGKVFAYVRAGRHGKNRKGKGADAYYARWVEFGTAAHWISVRADARPGRVTRRGYRTFSIGTLNRMAKRGSLVIGQNFVGASVRHPGARPKPYMRPAFASKAQEAIMAAAVYMRKRLATKHGLTRAESIEFEAA